MKIYHYHYRCGNKFWLDHKIGIGEQCPKCGKPFDKTNKMQCQVCDKSFYTDRDFNIGEKLTCPFHKGDVEVKKLIKEEVKEGVTNKKFVWLKLGIIIVLVLGFIYGFLKFFIWPISLPKVFLNTIQKVVPIIATTTIEILKWVGLTAAVLFILYIIIRVLTIRSVSSFDGILNSSRGRDPFDRLRELYQFPRSYPDQLIIRETVKRSHKVIQRQRLIVGILVLCIALIALKCSLSVNTSEQTVQVTKRAMQLGTANVVIFAVTFYAGKSFFSLDKRIESKPRHLKGLILSGVFGIATVLTMIFAPLIIKESLSGTTVAIELFINIVVDVLTCLYEKLTDLLWKKPREIFSIFAKYFKDKTLQAWKFVSAHCRHYLSRLKTHTKNRKNI